MALTLDGTNGIVSSGSITTQSATGVIFSDSSSLPAAASPYVLKNRIINGAMEIDQRNAGASITPTTTGTYSLDRWRCGLSVSSKYSVQQSTTVPTYFKNSLLVTSTSAYTVGAAETFNISQLIEGLNVADLGWGTANAKTVTLSFWVRSSLTGTFAGSLRNDNADRSYVFNYTISAANTWEQKTVTIAGDTTGTWLTTNGIGIYVLFSLGSGSTFATAANSWTAGNYLTSTGAVSVVGTNGATFYITGVQLEQNTSATPFERRLYNQELANCQRYFETSFSGGTAPANNSANTVNYASSQLSSVSGYTGTTLKVTKRTTPTVTVYSSNATASPPANQLQYFNNAGAGWTNATSTQGAAVTDNTLYFQWNNSGITTGYSYWTQFGWTASAEL
jgi:hypothetical protein